MISESLIDDPPVEPVLLFLSLNSIGLPLHLLDFNSSAPIVMNLFGLGFLDLGGNELLFLVSSFNKRLESAVPVSALNYFIFSSRSFRFLNHGYLLIRAV